MTGSDAVKRPPRDSDKAVGAPVSINHVSQIGSLLESGKDTDLTLKCGDRRWKVHKNVMCLQSQFFSSACDRDFKEAHSNLIDLSDDDQHALAAMIHFMYHNDYDCTVSFADEEDYDMLHHVRVFAIAQKYLVEPLQDLARGRALKAMADWDTLVFAETAREILTCTSDIQGGTTLRAAATTSIVEHLSTIYSKEVSDDKYEQMREVLRQIPDLESRIIAEQHAKIQNLECVTKLLNEDIGKLNGRVGKLMAYIGLPNGVPRAPAGSVPAGDPPLKYYRCPNCNAIFARSLQPNNVWSHNCYSRDLTGAQGVRMATYTGTGWDAHEVKLQARV